MPPVAQLSAPALKSSVAELLSHTPHSVLPFNDLRLRPRDGVGAMAPAKEQQEQPAADTGDTEGVRAEDDVMDEAETDIPSVDIARPPITTDGPAHQIAPEGRVFHDGLIHASMVLPAEGKAVPAAGLYEGRGLRDGSTHASRVLVSEGQAGPGAGPCEGRVFQDNSIPHANEAVVSRGEFALGCKSSDDPSIECKSAMDELQYESSDVSRQSMELQSGPCPDEREHMSHDMQSARLPEYAAAGQGVKTGSLVTYPRTLAVPLSIGVGSQPESKSCAEVRECKENEQVLNASNVGSVNKAHGKAEDHPRQHLSDPHVHAVYSNLSHAEQSTQVLHTVEEGRELWAPNNNSTQPHDAGPPTHASQHLQNRPNNRIAAGLFASPGAHRGSRPTAQVGRLHSSKKRAHSASDVDVVRQRLHAIIGRASEQERQAPAGVSSAEVSDGAAASEPSMQTESAGRLTDRTFEGDVHSRNRQSVRAAMYGSVHPAGGDRRAGLQFGNGTAQQPGVHSAGYSEENLKTGEGTSSGKLLTISSSVQINRTITGTLEHIQPGRSSNFTGAGRGGFRERDGRGELPTVMDLSDRDGPSMNNHRLQQLPGTPEMHKAAGVPSDVATLARALAGPSYTPSPAKRYSSTGAPSVDHSVSTAVLRFPVESQANRRWTTSATHTKDSVVRSEDNSDGHEWGEEEHGDGTNTSGSSIAKLAIRIGGISGAGEPASRDANMAAGLTSLAAGDGGVSHHELSLTHQDTGVGRAGSSERFVEHQGEGESASIGSRWGNLKAMAAFLSQEDRANSLGRDGSGRKLPLLRVQVGSQADMVSPSHLHLSSSEAAGPGHRHSNNNSTYTSPYPVNYVHPDSNSSLGYLPKPPFIPAPVHDPPHNSSVETLTGVEGNPALASHHGVGVMAPGMWAAGSGEGSIAFAPPALAGLPNFQYVAPDGAAGATVILLPTGELVAPADALQLLSGSTGPRRQLRRIVPRRRKGGVPYALVGASSAGEDVPPVTTSAQWPHAPPYRMVPACAPDVHVKPAVRCGSSAGHGGMDGSWTWENVEFSWPPHLVASKDGVGVRKGSKQLGMEADTSDASAFNTVAAASQQQVHCESGHHDTSSHHHTLRSMGSGLGATTFGSASGCRTSTEGDSDGADSDVEPAPRPKRRRSSAMDVDDNVAVPLPIQHVVALPAQGLPGVQPGIGAMAGGMMQYMQWPGAVQHMPVAAHVQAGTAQPYGAEAMLQLQVQPDGSLIVVPVGLPFVPLASGTGSHAQSTRVSARSLRSTLDSIPMEMKLGAHHILDPDAGQDVGCRPKQGLDLDEPVQMVQGNQSSPRQRSGSSAAHTLRISLPGQSTDANAGQRENSLRWIAPGTSTSYMEGVHAQQRFGGHDTGDGSTDTAHSSEEQHSGHEDVPRTVHGRRRTDGFAPSPFLTIQALPRGGATGDGAADDEGMSQDEEALHMERSVTPPATVPTKVGRLLAPLPSTRVTGGERVGRRPSGQLAGVSKVSTACGDSLSKFEQLALKRARGEAATSDPQPPSGEVLHPEESERLSEDARSGSGMWALRQLVDAAAYVDDRVPLSHDNNEQVSEGGDEHRHGNNVHGSGSDRPCGSSGIVDKGLRRRHGPNVPLLKRVSSHIVIPPSGESSVSLSASTGLTAEHTATAQAGRMHESAGVHDGVSDVEGGRLNHDADMLEAATTLMSIIIREISAGGVGPNKKTKKRPAAAPSRTRPQAKRLCEEGAKRGERVLVEREQNERSEVVQHDMDAAVATKGMTPDHKSVSGVPLRFGSGAHSARRTSRMTQEKEAYVGSDDTGRNVSPPHSRPQRERLEQATNWISPGPKVAPGTDDVVHHIQVTLPGLPGKDADAPLQSGRSSRGACINVVSASPPAWPQATAAVPAGFFTSHDILLDGAVALLHSSGLHDPSEGTGRMTAGSWSPMYAHAGNGGDKPLGVPGAATPSRRITHTQAATPAAAPVPWAHSPHASPGTHAQNIRVATENSQPATRGLVNPWINAHIRASKSDDRSDSNPAASTGKGQGPGIDNQRSLSTPAKRIPVAQRSTPSNHGGPVAFLSAQKPPASATVRSQQRALTPQQCGTSPAVSAGSVPAGSALRSRAARDLTTQFLDKYQVWASDGRHKEEDQMDTVTCNTLASDVGSGQPKGFHKVTFGDRTAGMNAQPVTDTVVPRIGVLQARTAGRPAGLDLRQPGLERTRSADSSPRDSRATSSDKTENPWHKAQAAVGRTGAFQGRDDMRTTIGRLSPSPIAAGTGSQAVHITGSEAGSRTPGVAIGTLSSTRVHDTNKASITVTVTPNAQLSIVQHGSDSHRTRSPASSSDAAPKAWPTIRGTDLAKPSPRVRATSPATSGFAPGQQARQAFPTTSYTARPRPSPGSSHHLRTSSAAPYKLVPPWASPHIPPAFVPPPTTVYQPSPKVSTAQRQIPPSSPFAAGLGSGWRASAAPAGAAGSSMFSPANPSFKPAATSPQHQIVSTPSQELPHQQTHASSQANGPPHAASPITTHSPHASLKDKKEVSSTAAAGVQRTGIAQTASPYTSAFGQKAAVSTASARAAAAGWPGAPRVSASNPTSASPFSSAPSSTATSPSKQRRAMSAPGHLTNAQMGINPWGSAAATVRHASTPASTAAGAMKARTADPSAQPSLLVHTTPRDTPTQQNVQEVGTLRDMAAGPAGLATTGLPPSYRRLTFSPSREATNGHTAGPDSYGQLAANPAAPHLPWSSVIVSRNRSQVHPAAAPHRQPAASLSHDEEEDVEESSDQDEEYAAARHLHSNPDDRRSRQQQPPVGHTKVAVFNPAPGVEQPVLPAADVGKKPMYQQGQGPAHHPNAMQGEAHEQECDALRAAVPVLTSSSSSLPGGQQAVLVARDAYAANDLPRVAVPEVTADRQAQGDGRAPVHPSPPRVAVPVVMVEKMDVDVRTDGPRVAVPQLSHAGAGVYQHQPARGLNLADPPSTDLKQTQWQ